MLGIVRIITGRRTAWVVLVGAIIAVGLLFALLPKSAGNDFPTSGLPTSSQAARVDALLADFPSAKQTSAIIVWSRGGADATGAESALTEADKSAITARAAELGALSTAPRATTPRFSDDGLAAISVVPLEAAAVSADVKGTATDIRAAASSDLPAGLSSYVTGPVGFQADISNAFAGADFRLLLVTVIVVAVLLIITYRSPVLWIVPLVVVGLADGLAGVVVSALAGPFGITLDASVSGIQSVLVFGAGTNYALLLVARYREELLHTESRNEAMRIAVRSAGPAIAASGGTVALSLLTLLFAELSGNRALGFACAIGVVIAILFALIVLPAALVVCGRGLFWPFVPRYDPASPRVHTGFWSRLGRGVARRPVAIIVASALGLGALSLGLVGASVGLSQADQLLGNPESVQAQAIVDASFSSGLTSQTVVLAPDASATEAASLATATPGVATVQPGESANGRTRLNLQLSSEPGSETTFATITALRTTYADAGGAVADSLVGGTDATALDTRTSSQRDQDLILPMILAIVFGILALLLRSLVAPVLLILSVLATFFASLGASNLIFQNLLGFPAFNTNVVLFAFLFLVALGVDYNIFLTTRAREEARLHGTREGMVRALSSTGAVITSAGILIAAVFVVLGVLPVVALAQIGVIVCLGVLLDTLLVRTLVVPALVFLTGDRFWWPSRPALRE
ncbi:MMPL family transporter [Cryobacterium breve]|uniref:MMPL family transporter n=1 Tax=Cryobacterium breve TaxID=1259258 RepID=A0ABY7NDE8_9MICO|nr:MULTISPECIES: MMPL family transporter [Cryobacterium]MDY7542890.1 MMPL family transporter [Cryobacterium sp. 5B3]MEB0000464.1 MMPL family transporter [Cryobacterium sp. RTS3]MEB0267351.1 MMPL family transporter [Cryobacterium sp. 10I5]MEB0275719.1 MMPL family transporter [Cryobacterium sp. 5B3]WBM79568.1 MMPL family transporter [Cryobacterium breve]